MKAKEMVLVAALLVASAAAQAGPSHNPQNDPDVERGYQEHQRWYQERQREERADQARREHDNARQAQDGQPHNSEQWARNQYPQGDNDKYGIKLSHDQPQR